MIAAIIAAVMSSADSCLSCLTAVVMEDSYRRHVNPSATDHQLLRVAQASTLLLGAAAAIFALLFRNVADILIFVYDFWAPRMVLPFIVAVFWYDKSHTCAVVASMIFGMVAMIVWRFGLGSSLDIGPTLFGCGATSLAFIVILPLTSRFPLGRLFRPCGNTSANGDFA